MVAGDEFFNPELVEEGIRTPIKLDQIPSGLTASQLAPWLLAAPNVELAGQWAETYEFDTSLIDWIATGLSPAEADRWEDAGFDATTTHLLCGHVDGPDDATAWKNAGFSPAATRKWASRGFTLTQARALTRSKVSPTRADRLRQQGFSIPAIERWGPTTLPPEIAEQWSQEGVEPEAAERRHAAGLNPPRQSR